MNEYVLASAHDTSIKLWDLRKGSVPFSIISEAHPTKIYSIDWSKSNEFELLSCNLDNCVKIWDIQTQYSSEISTESGCWKAKYAVNLILISLLETEF